MSTRPYINKKIDELKLIFLQNKEDERILLDVRYELDLSW